MRSYELSEEVLVSGGVYSRNEAGGIWTFEGPGSDSLRSAMATCTPRFAHQSTPWGIFAS